MTPTTPDPTAAEQITEILNNLFTKAGVKFTEIGWELAGELSQEATAEIMAALQRSQERAVLELQKAKDNAYWERDQLVAALSKVYPAWLGYHKGKDWEDDWRTIVYIKIPNWVGNEAHLKQVSWHIHDSEKQYFTHLDPGLEEWDGHTTEEKYERLSALIGEKTE